MQREGGRTLAHRVRGFVVLRPRHGGRAHGDVAPRDGGCGGAAHARPLRHHAVACRPVDDGRVQVGAGAGHPVVVARAALRLADGPRLPARAHRLVRALVVHGARRVRLQVAKRARGAKRLAGRAPVRAVHVVLARPRAVATRVERLVLELDAHARVLLHTVVRVVLVGPRLAVLAAVVCPPVGDGVGWPPRPCAVFPWAWLILPWPWGLGFQVLRLLLATKGEGGTGSQHLGCIWLVVKRAGCLCSWVLVSCAAAKANAWVSKAQTWPILSWAWARVINPSLPFGAKGEGWCCLECGSVPDLPANLIVITSLCRHYYYPILHSKGFPSHEPGSDDSIA
mmetsp:Transcript_7911/g.19790  ORF Transcript_7911/g.19790 Transcript_7911/m.19790 type:complete len:339 (-) Transcript_7911:30-1046(-)